MSIENSIESKPNQIIVDNMYTVMAQESKYRRHARVDKTRIGPDRTGPDHGPEHATVHGSDHGSDH